MKHVLFASVAALCVCLVTADSQVADYDADAKNTTSGNYTLFSEKGKVCFILTAKISYSVTAPGGDPKKMWTGDIYDEGNKQDVTGTCLSKDGTTSSITISNSDVSRPVEVSFEFEQNETTKSWEGTSASIKFPGVPDEEVSEESLSFTGPGRELNSTPADQGLSCSKLTVTLNGTNGAGQIFLSGVTLKPGFVNFTKPTVTCPYDKSPSTSNVVPIAVGCALAGLVLIVLVAYLIGRTRHGRPHKGYQSV